MHHLDFIARAVKDKDFRARFIANPEQVLRESGTDLSGGQIKVVENTADIFYVAMPENPNDFLDDSYLEKVSGGGFFSKIKKAIKGSGIKASSAGTAISTASSADIANVAGKNTETVTVVSVRPGEDGYYEPTGDVSTETHRIK